MRRADARAVGCLAMGAAGVLWRVWRSLRPPSAVGSRPLMPERACGITITPGSRSPDPGLREAPAAAEIPDWGYRNPYRV